MLFAGSARIPVSPPSRSFRSRIGIGANTAIFSLVNAVLLQPLAYKDPQRLFAVREIQPSFRRLETVAVNPVHAREWADECPSLEQVALMRGGPRQMLAGGGEPVSVPGARVPHNFFALFGVEPILGRTFLPEEEQEGNDRVVILSRIALALPLQCRPVAGRQADPGRRRRIIRSSALFLLRSGPLMPATPRSFVLSL